VSESQIPMGDPRSGDDAGRARPVTPRLVFGLAVIALGVLFTLDNLGVLEAGEILRWWPAVLVAYGLSRLTGASGRRNTTLGLIFTFAGVLLLLHDFDLIQIDPWDFWPVVLVVLGASMVTRAMRHTSGTDARETPGAATDSTLSTFVVWAGIERKVVSPDFRGGDVTAIMGGADIDLRQAKMPGGRAVIDLTVIWGGVDLYVPGDWTVTVEALPLMAGIEDSTRAPAGEIRGNLVLRGVVLMGGVEIKN
jgi:predicted membrane protein